MNRWMDWLTPHPEAHPANENMTRIWSNGTSMCKTLHVGSQVMQTFPTLLIISSLLSRLFPSWLSAVSSCLLTCQQTFGIQHLHIDYELEESLFASLNHGSQFHLSCLYQCPPLTSVARGKLLVSHLCLYLPLSVTHSLASCVSIPSSWLLCVHVAPSPPLCEGLYLVRGIKISSCRVEAQKRSSGQLTWTQCATYNPHLLHRL